MRYDQPGLREGPMTNCKHRNAQAGVPTSKGTIYWYCPDCGATKKDNDEWHVCDKCRLK
jgi:hypothetical protein